MSDWLANQKFGVENALNMYASRYVHMPAMDIYDDAALKRFEEPLRSCHIYLIGLLPKIMFVRAGQEDDELITTLQVQDKSYDLRWPIPPGFRLKQDDGLSILANDETGKTIWPNRGHELQRLAHEQDAIHFKVLYIGQAYGENGSRNAINRLKSHSTLQQIAVQGIPEGSVLSLLMLEVVPGTRMLTVFNPHAKLTDQDDERISNGIDKLFSTTEPERITLYEAALIRYFQPKFNKEFKNSFPSTNMKLLADCYQKDMAAVVAEICIDELAFKLCSDHVKPKPYHSVVHALHTDADRQAFFLPKRG